MKGARKRGFAGGTPALPGRKPAPISAFAGMTERARLGGARSLWIPAFAGMTGGG